MRWFHGFGMRRDSGFQAVMKPALRAPMPNSTASIAAERRPIRTVTPAA